MMRMQKKGRVLHLSLLLSLLLGLGLAMGGRAPLRANAASPAPPAYRVITPVGYDSQQFGSKQYAYVDSSDHVQELYYARVNGYWRWNDLTALTGAPLVMRNEEESLIGFDSPQFGSKEYAYVAQNGHIIE